MILFPHAARLRVRMLLLAVAPFVARAAQAQTSQAQASQAQASQAQASKTQPSQVQTAQVLPDASSVGATPFELQRSLLEIDEQRRRLEVSLEPVDSILRVLARDSAHVAATIRPAAVDRDLATVRTIVGELSQAPDSPELATRLAAAVDQTMRDFTSIEHGLGVRVVDGAAAQETLARSPTAGVIALDAAPSVSATSLWDKLHRADSARQPLASITDGDVARFQSAVGNTAFMAYRSALLDAISRRIADLRQTRDQGRADVQRLRGRAALLAHTIGAQDGSSVQLDSRLIAVALPVFAVVLLIVLLAPRVYRSVELQAYIFTSGLLLEITTLVLVTGTVLALGLGGRVHAETIGTLLGALGGFLLGRTVPRRGLELSPAPVVLGAAVPQQYLSVQPLEPVPQYAQEGAAAPAQSRQFR